MRLIFEPKFFYETESNYTMSRKQAQAIFGTTKKNTGIIYLTSSRKERRIND